MARERSPNYPSVGLGNAVEDIKAIYRKHGRASVPVEEAVKVWGYGSLSGASRPRIASLRQYGLIEQRVNGPLKVSGSALTLALRSPESPEYAAALREAALTPPLFRDLYEGWRSEPDDAVLHFLIADRHFSPEGARRALAAFQSTLEFAGLTDSATMLGPDLDEPLTDEEDGMVIASAPPTTHSPREPRSTYPAEVGPRPSSLPAVQLPLSGLPWATLQAPFPLTPEAWEQMLAVLNAMKPALVSAPPAAPEQRAREPHRHEELVSFTREPEETTQ